jgi:hypothetical protein
MNAPESYPLEILLFDMDGVLLVPAGYHLALQETVATIGRALGFSKAHLGTETIAQFEAAGATSEWDSSAICAVLLLIRLWERYPHGRLTARSLSDPHTPHDLPAPDFHAFARSLAETGPVHTPPLPRAETLLIDHAPDWSPTQIAHLRELLQGAREIDRSITHRMFQEFVLGSELFNEIYGLSPLFSLAGYLETCDQPALDLQTVKSLNAWLASSYQRAAIFTNRPTLEPDGLAGTPEGELGLATTGLQNIPLIGWGQLYWLSRGRGLAEGDFSKPAAAHALAALRCALGDPLEVALAAAADLQMGRESTGWGRLNGARISAFEDGAAGLVSARAAGRLLAQQGISTDIRLYGISQEKAKQQALADVGGQLFPDLAAALRAAGVKNDHHSW